MHCFIGIVVNIVVWNTTALMLSYRPTIWAELRLPGPCRLNGRLHLGSRELEAELGAALSDAQGNAKAVLLGGRVPPRFVR